MKSKNKEQNMETNKPSIGRIFQTDYLTTVWEIFILVIWGFFLSFKFIQPIQLANPLFYAAVIVTVIGIGIMTWRIRLIQSIFEDGAEVEGTVVSINFYRDRGYVTYVYEVKGKRYQSSNAIAKYRVTEQLKQGQRVRIVAEQNNPKIAFIKNIYL
jgi:hypothetical protein